MTVRRSLPVTLPGAFSVARALEAGATENRLRATDLRAPFHGTRVPSAHDGSLELACRALATRFRPGDAFTGPTAALLWGMPLPVAWTASSTLHVSSLLPTRSLRRRGVVGSSRAGTDPVLLDGLPVLPVPDTCLALAAFLPLDDLVAVLDFVVTGPNGRGSLSSPGDLARFVAARSGAGGVATLRRALALCRQGSWSRPETLLRLRLARAGIPEPVLNGRLTHPRGRIIVPDLAWPQYRVAAEYNGAHHEQNDQRVRDLRRVDDFTDLGWTTVNIAKEELFGAPDSAVRRVAARLQAAGWRPPPSLRLPKSASGGVA